MTPNNVNESMYAYTIKCTSTFVYKLKLTDFLWYRDIGWYRDTRTGIIVAMTKSSIGTILECIAYIICCLFDLSARQLILRRDAARGVKHWLHHLC